MAKAGRIPITQKDEQDVESKIGNKGKQLEFNGKVEDVYIILNYRARQ